MSQKMQVTAAHEACRRRQRTSSMLPCSTWKRSSATAACALLLASAAAARAPAASPPASLLAALRALSSPLRRAPAASACSRPHVLTHLALLSAVCIAPPVCAASLGTFGAPLPRPLRPRQRGTFLGGLRLACRRPGFRLLPGASASPQVPKLPRRCVLRCGTPSPTTAEHTSAGSRSDWPLHALRGTAAAPRSRSSAGWAAGAASQAGAGARAPSMSIGTGGGAVGLPPPLLAESSQSASRSLRNALLSACSLKDDGTHVLMQGMLAQSLSPLYSWYQAHEQRPKLLK